MMEKQLTLFLPIKELLLEFPGRGEVKGYYFKQIKALNFGYIYEVSASNGYVWYEVFKRKIDSRFGKIGYPNANAFGKTAWSVFALDRAFEIYEQIKVAFFAMKP